MFSKIPAPDHGWPDLQPALDATLSPAENTLSSLGPASPKTPTSVSTPLPVVKIGTFHLSSPQRPQKAFGNFPLIPSSPISPSTRRHNRPSSIASNIPRTPLSVIQAPETPSKRRRLLAANDSANKENDTVNASPLVSVAERINEILKSGGSAKKRKFEVLDDGDSNTPTPTKRLRSRMKPKQKGFAHQTSEDSPCSINSCESRNERRLVENILLPAAIPFPSMTTEGTPNPAIAEKTSPIILDLPTRKSAVSFDGAVPKIDFTKLYRGLRRSASIPGPLNFNSFAGKRKRESGHVYDDSDLYDQSDPIPALQIEPSFMTNAKRSVSMPLRVRRASQWPDSDDTAVSHSDDDPKVVPDHSVSTNAVKKEWNLTISSRPIRSKVEDLYGSDDTLPGSDDSTSSGDVSEESPIKVTLLRRTRSQARLAKTLIN